MKKFCLERLVEKADRITRDTRLAVLASSAVEKWKHGERPLVEEIAAVLTLRELNRPVHFFTDRRDCALDRHLFHRKWCRIENIKATAQTQKE